MITKKMKQLKNIQDCLSCLNVLNSENVERGDKHFGMKRQYDLNAKNARVSKCMV